MPFATVVVLIWSLFAANTAVHGVQQYRVEKAEQKAAAVQPAPAPAPEAK